MSDKVKSLIFCRDVNCERVQIDTPWVTHTELPLGARFSYLPVLASCAYYIEL